MYTPCWDMRNGVKWWHIRNLDMVSAMEDIVEIINQFAITSHPFQRANA